MSRLGGVVLKRSKNLINFKNFGLCTNKALIGAKGNKIASLKTLLNQLPSFTSNMSSGIHNPHCLKLLMVQIMKMNQYKKSVLNVSDLSKNALRDK